MSLMNWFEMIGCFVAAGWGALTGYRRYQSRKLDKQFPEKKS